MTKAAIDQIKDNKEGFVLQVEGGKVDWAAHANDVAALIHDQLAFEEAVKAVMDFAEKDGNTLVIITTDHGNANPGTIYGAEATRSFNTIANYKYTNEYILNNIHENFNLQQMKDWILKPTNLVLPTKKPNICSVFIQVRRNRKKVYTITKMPFKAYSEIQKNIILWAGSVWITPEIM